jgi:hypothetical protein
MGLQGSLQEQARKFVVGAGENPQSVHDNLMRFFSHQIERSARKEISETTIPNYYKSVKLFCEMNGLVFNWKKIARILPRRRNTANDRAPTIEEIRRLTEYPDRRIKPIVYTMVSSGVLLVLAVYLANCYKPSCNNVNIECSILEECTALRECIEWFFDI